MAMLRLPHALLQSRRRGALALQALAEHGGLASERLGVRLDGAQLLLRRGQPRLAGVVRRGVPRRLPPRRLHVCSR